MIGQLARSLGWVVLALAAVVGASAAGFDILGAGLWTTTMLLGIVLLAMLWPILLPMSFAATGLGLSLTTAIFSLAPVDVPGDVLLPIASLAAAAFALRLTAPAGIGRAGLLGLALLAGLTHLMAMHALAVALHGPVASYFSAQPFVSFAVPTAWAAAGAVLPVRA
jgi:hypothetical protein